MDSLLILFILLPQIAIFGLSLPSDNQIFFLIPFAILSLKQRNSFSINSISIPFLIYIPLILMIVGCLLGIIFLPNYLDERILKFNIKSLISYALIPILFIIGKYLSYKPRFVYKSLSIVISMLFIVFIIQYIYPNIFNLFISRAIKDVADTRFVLRGNRSLFAEPSFLSSYVMLYNIMLIYIKTQVLKEERDNKLLVLIGMSLFMLILSMSGQSLICLLMLMSSFILAIFYICAKLIISYIYRKDKIIPKFILKNITYLLFIFSSLIIIVTKYLPESARIRYFLNMFLAQRLIFNDESLMVRLHAIYLPFATPIYDTFNIIPSKSGYYIKNINTTDFISSTMENYGIWFNSITGGVKTTIYGFSLPNSMYSILGNLSYDFSFIGLIFSILFLLLISKSIKNTINPNIYSKNYYKNKFIELFFIIFFILYSYINLSLLCPPYWFFAGFIYGTSSQSRIKLNPS